MARFKVVLTEHGYASTRYEREVIEAAGGEFIDAGAKPLSEALRLAEDAEAVMCRRAEITAERIKQFRRCKTIVRYGIGTDNIDLQAATAAGIVVGHVPDYCIDEVSVHAIGLWLACVRRIVYTHQKVTAGQWDVHRTDPIWRVAGRTFGLVGLGKIGRAVAGKLQGWGLRLLATDPYVEPEVARALNTELVSLEDLLRQSDYVSLHTPLLPETRGLINAQSLSWIKRGAMLVNTARGPLVDGQALLNALESGQVGQAGLDVFEEEPLPAGSPLLGHPRVVISDHAAWYSEESQVDLQRKAAQVAVAVCRGQLPGSLANPEVLVRLGRFDQWEPAESMRWQLKRLEGMA